MVGHRQEEAPYHTLSLRQCSDVWVGATVPYVNVEVVQGHRRCAEHRRRQHSGLGLHRRQRPGSACSPVDHGYRECRVCRRCTGSRLGVCW